LKEDFTKLKWWTREEKDGMKAFPGGKGRSLLLFLFFAAVAVLITWPLLANIADALYGRVGDPLTTVWSLKWFKEAAYSGQGSIWQFPYAAYPHGIRTTFSFIYLPLAPFYSFPRGETVLYNLLIILSIALNGYVMYLLGKKLYRSDVAAVGMGLVFMLCPYALTRAAYHLSLVPIFIFPLLLYTLINLKEDFSTANKVKVFFALLLAFNTHPYYTVMALLMLAVLSVCYIVKRVRRGIAGFKPDYRFIRICILLCALTLLIAFTLSFVYLEMIKSNTTSLSRQEGDLYTYAGHTWNYLVPSPDSFFLGGSVQQFIKDRVLSTNIEEFVLFLGYTNLGLALIAAFFWFTRKRIKLSKALTEDLDRRAGWVVPFAVLTALVFFAWSLPPTMKLGGVTLYLPSWFTYKLVPSIRVYARFGVLVFFSATLLSGACLSFLEKSLARKRRLVRYLIPILLLALMLSEFVMAGNKPLQRIYDQDPVYTEVENLPEEDVIAEYPFVASDEAYNYEYLWNALFHHKRMLNGYPLGTEGESLRNCVLNLYDERTPGLLSYMGADYVVAHRDLLEMGSEYSYPRGDMETQNLPAGFEIVWQGADADLLRVTATRPRVVVIYEPRFSTVLTQEFGNGWWLGAQKKWIMKLDAESDMTVDISFAIFSVQGERTLHIDQGAGREETFIIGEDATSITLEDVHLDEGINRIYLSTDEDPTPYKDVFGGYDSKGVCFAMSFWEVK
jgi:hypothetical protein